jgi:hypothetical protein
MPNLNPMVQTACAQIIQVLECHLDAARRLRDAYDRGALPLHTAQPIRHFCADLVEAAIELSRDIGTLRRQCERTGGQVRPDDIP